MGRDALNAVLFPADVRRCDVMKFLHVSPEDALVYARRLANQVINSGFKPDTIVAILRGGVVIARLLSDFLDVRDIRSIRVVHYDALDVKKGAEVVEPLPTRLDGKRVLLVDDVADTGDSLIVAREHLLKKGAKEVKIATMHYKPWSKLKPDFYSEETEAWVIYFWEYAETVRYFFTKHSEKGYEYILGVLREAGVPDEVVKWVVKNEGYLR